MAAFNLSISEIAALVTSAHTIFPHTKKTLVFTMDFPLGPAQPILFGFAPSGEKPTPDNIVWQNYNSVFQPSLHPAELQDADQPPFDAIIWGT